MFICLDCGLVFEEPEHYVDTHGLDSPLYEYWNGCPECGGAYTETYCCDACGEWIAGEYVEIGDQKYCENCFIIKNLED